MYTCCMNCVVHSALYVDDDELNLCCLCEFRSLLDVMSESKALSMIGVPLPEVARSILAQEVRVKQFRLSLQQVLDEFHHTLTSLDPPLQSLLVSHTDAVIRYTACIYTCALTTPLSVVFCCVNFQFHFISCVSTLQVPPTRLF